MLIRLSYQDCIYKYSHILTISYNPWNNQSKNLLLISRLCVIIAVVKNDIIVQEHNNTNFSTQNMDYFLRSLVKNGTERVLIYYFKMYGIILWFFTIISFTMKKGKKYKARVFPLTIYNQQFIKYDYGGFLYLHSSINSSIMGSLIQTDFICPPFLSYF